MNTIYAPVVFLFWKVVKIWYIKIKWQSRCR